MTETRDAPVVDFAARDVEGVVSVLSRAMGKVVSLAPLVLVEDLAGYQILNAAATTGTDIVECRIAVNFGDAGIDHVRVVVRGKNSTSGSVAVQVYRVTGSATIATVNVTGTSVALFQGAWTVIKPTGGDEEIGLRVVGDGAMDPTIARVEVQLRTLRANA